MKLAIAARMAYCFIPLSYKLRNILSDRCLGNLFHPGMQGFLIQLYSIVSPGGGVQVNQNQL